MDFQTVMMKHAPSVFDFGLLERRQSIALSASPRYSGLVRYLFFSHSTISSWSRIIQMRRTNLEAAASAIDALVAIHPGRYNAHRPLPSVSLRDEG